MGSGGVRDDHGSGVAVQTVQVERTEAAVSSWYGFGSTGFCYVLICVILVVKGIYVTWSNDPPNTKIKDWNVTELKVGSSSSALLSIILKSE